MSNQAAIQCGFKHDENTRMIGWLPVYHDMGLIGNTFQPLYLGAQAVMFAPMTFLTSPATWLQTISQWQGTTSGAPSFAYELCAKRITDEEMQGLDLSSWSVAYNGAEPEATLFISGGKPGQPVVEMPVDRELLKLNKVAKSTQTPYRLVFQVKMENLSLMEKLVRCGCPDHPLLKGIGDSRS